MNRRIFTLLFGIYLPVATAVLGVSNTAFAQKNSEAVRPSIISLIATPERYNKRKVFVEGYINIEFEGDSICLLKTPAHKDCLWLSIWPDNENLSQRRERLKIWEEFQGKQATVRGIFLMANKGHMGSYSGELQNIEYVVDKETRATFNSDGTITVDHRR